MRDPEFEDCLHAFRATTRLNDTYRVPEEKRMRIGIIQCAIFLLSGMHDLTRIAEQHWSARWRHERRDAHGRQVLLVPRSHPGRHLQRLRRLARG